MTLPANPRRRWRLPAFALGLVALAFAEVALLTILAQQIGLAWVVVELVVSAVSGGWAIRRQGGRAGRGLAESLATGSLAADQLAAGALALLGGLLLIIPGIISDLAGLFCLLPWTRPLAQRTLLALAGAPLKSVGSPASRPGENSTVIEGEIVEPPD